MNLLIVLITAIVCLAVVNVAAVKYLNVWGLFVLGASSQLADKMIDFVITNWEKLV